jgi:iron-sulfur cluster repair protein YtfE (RIC family)
MDIRKLLERDHREVEEDFRALERADYEDEDLIEKVILELTIHAELEERVFYPALDEATDTDLVEQARADHEEVKDLIAELRAATSRRRGDIIEQMKTSVLEHVEEEESEIFPMALKELGRDRLEEMGDMAEQVREEFLAGRQEEAIEGDTEAEVTGEDFRAVAEELEEDRHPES